MTWKHRYVDAYSHQVNAERKWKRSKNKQKRSKNKRQIIKVNFHFHFHFRSMWMGLNLLQISATLYSCLFWMWNLCKSWGPVWGYDTEHVTSYVFLSTSLHVKVSTTKSTFYGKPKVCIVGISDLNEFRLVENRINFNGNFKVVNYKMN